MSIANNTPLVGSRTENRITSVAIENFKSITSPQEVQFRGLTLLAGANSSGKSSAMQPLLLMKQTLEASYDPGTFLLDGPNVRFSSAKQVVSIGKKNFSISFSSVKDWKTTFSYEIQKSSGFQLKTMTMTDLDGSLHRITAGMRYSDLEPRMGNRDTMVMKALTDAFDRSQVSSDRCLMNLGPFDLFMMRASSKAESSQLISGQPLIREMLLNLLHLPGLRGTPERTYKTSATSNPFPGSFETYCASVIHQWKDAGSETKLKLLGSTMADLGLTNEVTSERIDDTRVELKVAHTNAANSSKRKRDFVSIADVGLGVSQVLPVLVALQVALKNQIVYLEQPEIHLHPKAQFALATVIARAVKRGVIVIAETHSSLVIRGVQTLVASGELPGSDVGLHWFSRNPKTGVTKISFAELDENGAFGEWPADFDDVQLNASRGYLDAVSKRYRL